VPFHSPNKKRKELIVMKKMLSSLIIVLVVMFVGSVAFADVDNAATATVEKVEAGAGASIDDHSSTRIKNYDRNLPIPGNVPLPQTNGFFTIPTPDSSFRSVKELIEVLAGDNATSVRISEGALEEMAKGGDVESHLQVIRGKNIVKRVGADEDDVRWLTIAYHKPIIKMIDGKARMVGVVKPKNVMATGMIDGEADDGDTNSYQVLGKCGLKALRDGNSILVVETEGAHRKVEAWGAGIGLYTVGGQVSDGGQTSGVLGGGTGVAWNEVGPEDRPWIQGYVGVINGEVIKKVVKVEKVSMKKETPSTDKAVEKATAKEENKKVWGTINGASHNVVTQ